MAVVDEQTKKNTAALFSVLPSAHLRDEAPVARAVARDDVPECGVLLRSEKGAGNRAGERRAGRARKQNACLRGDAPRSRLGSPPASTSGARPPRRQHRR